MNSRTLKVILTILCLTQVSPIHFHAYQIDHETWSSQVLPSNYSLLTPSTSADLNADGLLDTWNITNGRLDILSGTDPLWQSPPEWQVEQTLLSDLNRDSQPELTLLVTRPFKPWPIDRWLTNGGRISSFQDSQGNSSHIILIGWQEDRFQELWAGSSMSAPARKILIADLNLDGVQELLTIEGDYNLPQFLPARAIKLWEWNGFGFSLLSTLTGSFYNMNLLSTPEKPVNFVLLLN